MIDKVRNSTPAPKIRISLILTLLLTAGLGYGQTTYSADDAVMSFFSYTPIEDIKAESKEAMGAIDVSTGSVYFKVRIRSFQFRKSLMREHFNEKYMESGKYPYAEFRGRILEIPDLSRSGEYSVTVKGDLNIHGVSRAYTTQATLKAQGTSIQATSSFKVRLADHRIRIPSIVIANIAEVVDVSVSALLKKKPQAK